MTSILICGAPSAFPLTGDIHADTAIKDAVPCSQMKKEHPEFAGSRDIAPEFTMLLFFIYMWAFWIFLRLSPKMIRAQR